MNPILYLRNGVRWLVDPYRLLDEYARRYGLTFRIRLPVLGDVLMTGDPELIAGIAHHQQLDGGKAVTALRAIFGGRSLIMLEGAAHVARRRLIAPSFCGDALPPYDALTVRVTRAMLVGLPRGATFSMYAVLRRIALKVMVAAMFGEDAAVASEAEGLVERFLNSFQNALILFFRPLRLDAGPWSPWGRAVRNRRALGEFIRRQLRCRATSSSDSTLLKRLADAATSASLGEEDVVEEVLSLLLFGHDTAAATMSWVFAHVYGDGNLVDRIRGEANGQGDEPSCDLDALEFLKACIQESMRLCPVVVHLARTAAVDVRLGDYHLRQGQKVIPCTYLAQRNPAVFPEPHRFRPERFLHGRRYEYSYFPFGFGGRTCVGKPFAMRQMLLVLSTTVRSVDLQLAPGYRPAPARHLVLIVPRAGTPMRRR